MNKILHIAAREFKATVMTRGFMIGLLLMPAVLALAFTVGPRLMSQRARPIEGIVAVIDPTGQVTARLRDALRPQAVAARRADAVAEGLPSAMRQAGLSDTAVQQARSRALGDAPTLHVVDIQDAGAGRRWLLENGGENRLAVVTVHKNAVQSDGELGSYDLSVAPRLDLRVENGIYDGMREALVAARADAGGLDRQRLEAVMRVPRPQSVTMTAAGDRQSDNGFSQALPFLFIGLMFFGVMVGGQGLMTTTIEEKSSRVVEVLLSAVSPIELMTGKILGQLAVSALTLGLYLGLGATVLWSLAMIGLIQPILVVYLVVFYVLGYMTLGALMAAIGAAVNEMREAQSLMTPITLAIMVPWVLAAPILRNPSSTFATTISFIPPINAFAMLLRVTSNAPPPVWQVVLSMLTSLVGVAAAFWFAAKVFRIGLLMFGKPPDFATLVRWVRMA